MKEIEISADDARREFSVCAKHGLMPNGERRFRLTFDDGNNYARTVAGQTGGWQDAHKHTALKETYIVEKGWMALVTVENENSNLDVNVFWPSEVVTIEPKLPHNIYLPPNAVIHTMKHGASGPGDWTDEPWLTKQCVSVTERDLLKTAKQSCASMP